MLLVFVTFILGVFALLAYAIRDVSRPVPDAGSEARADAAGQEHLLEAS